jgi:hypothetical protein
MKLPVLFISHAAVDSEIALALKKAFSPAFPDIEIFVSSDPESLAPGDPWIDKILEALENTSLVLALTTERGLSRKWVWFESGRTWYSGVRLLTCSLGLVRKSSLPAPFSFIQGLNVDEASDLERLLKELATVFGPPQTRLDFAALSGELIRLDVRAEERNKAEEDPDAAELRKMISKRMGLLPPVQRETIRQVLIYGELSNLSARTVVQGTGQDMGQYYVLDALARETGFLTQTHHTQNLNNYELNAFKINEKLAPHLREYFKNAKS